MSMRRLLQGAAFGLALLVSGSAFAGDKALAPTASPAPAQISQEQENALAFEAAMKASRPGPADVALLQQAVMNLPKGYLFVPRSEGDRLMRAFGNRTGPNFIGLIMPAENANWFATIDFQNAGFVKDDDAKTWKADELLQSLKDGTDAGNEERQQRGFPPIEVAGWVEPPEYSSATHRLVWAASVRRKGDTGTGSVNHNTYALGREGYFELNMIGSADVIMKEKARAQELLAALNYVPGKAYGDFNASTDRVAEYGLAALIAGVAAKKLGAFALIAVFLVKAWKIVALALFGGMAAISRLFKRSPPAGPPPSA